VIVCATLKFDVPQLKC